MPWHESTWLESNMLWNVFPASQKGLPVTLVCVWISGNSDQKAVAKLRLLCQIHCSSPYITLKLHANYLTTMSISFEFILVWLIWSRKCFSTLEKTCDFSKMCPDRLITFLSPASFFSSLVRGSVMTNMNLKQTVNGIFKRNF